MKRIAFGYKMRSGKDTAVEYLMNKYGGVRVSFADPLYDILYYAQNVCGFEKAKDRKFLQFIGTEWAREKDNDVWINMALRKTNESLGNVYVSDVRFRNEFDAMKKNNFVLIKINRDSGQKNSHSSETELDLVPDHEWDFIFDNNGTLEEFYSKIDLCMNNI
jgi:hypothetical protein